MKFHAGYIFDAGINVVRDLGFNEWMMNEGQADKYTELYIEDADKLELAVKHNLSEQESLIWAIKERIEDIDLELADIENLKEIEHLLSKIQKN